MGKMEAPTTMAIPCSVNTAEYSTLQVNLFEGIKCNIHEWHLFLSIQRGVFLLETQMSSWNTKNHLKADTSRPWAGLPSYNWGHLSYNWPVIIKNIKKTPIQL